MGIGELIKYIRTKHGLNQTEMGDLMLRNRDFVYMVENDRIEPNTKDLTELSKALSEPLLLYIAYGKTLDEFIQTQK